MTSDTLSQHPDFTGLYMKRTAPLRGEIRRDGADAADGDDPEAAARTIVEQPALDGLAAPPAQLGGATAVRRLVRVAVALEYEEDVSKNRKIL